MPWAGAANRKNRSHHRQLPGECCAWSGAELPAISYHGTAKLTSAAGRGSLWFLVAAANTWHPAAGATRVKPSRRWRTPQNILPLPATPGRAQAVCRHPPAAWGSVRYRSRFSHNRTVGAQLGLSDAGKCPYFKHLRSYRCGIRVAMRLLGQPVAASSVLVGRGLFG